MMKYEDINFIDESHCLFERGGELYIWVNEYSQIPVKLDDLVCPDCDEPNNYTFRELLEDLKKKEDLQKKRA